MPRMYASHQDAGHDVFAVITRVSFEAEFDRTTTRLDMSVEAKQFTIQQSGMKRLTNENATICMRPEIFFCQTSVAD